MVDAEAQPPRQPIFGFSARALLFPALLMAGQCGLAAEGASAPAAGAAGASAKALIGDAVCETDAECRTVAVGAKACGGPEAYLAWSTRNVDPAALERAAAATRSRAGMVNALPGGQMSTCSLVQDPGARCVPASLPRTASGKGALAGVCRLAPPPASGPAPLTDR